jgi:hypothetical protein
MARPKKVIKVETLDGEVHPIEIETNEPIETPQLEEEKGPTLIRWKKVGGGSLYWKNKIIKPGQIFWATVDEIPKAFRDTILPVDELPEEPILIESKSTNYTLNQNGNLWDIVDKRGKAINEKPMERANAESLLKVL